MPLDEFRLQAHHMLQCLRKRLAGKEVSPVVLDVLHQNDDDLTELLHQHFRPQTRMFSEDGTFKLKYYRTLWEALHAGSPPDVPFPSADLWNGLN